MPSAARAVFISLLLVAGLALAQVPASNHVVVVLEENHSYSSVVGNINTPYLNGLISKYGLATQYYANTHPSVGNYFMLTTGQIITNNDSYTTVVTVDNLVRQLLLAGKTWKSYAESLPSVGYTGDDVDPYVKHHNPFSYFSDVANSSSEVLNLVPFTQFATDLANHQLPNYSFVTPDESNDAHDCPTGMTTCTDGQKLANADQWLHTNIDPLINDADFQQDGLLIIVFDESITTDITNGGGRVAFVVIGPKVLPAYQSGLLYQHQSALRLTCDALGISTCPGAGAAAAPMGEFFNASLGRITGTVTSSATQSPIAGASVSYSGGTAVTNSTGAFILSGIAAGTVAVTASAPGYLNSVRTVTVNSGAATPQNFSLTPSTGTVAGTVSDSAGSPIGGATVSYSGGLTTTSATGAYTLTQVPAGTVLVSASATGYVMQSNSVSVSANTLSPSNFVLAAGSGPGPTLTFASSADAYVNSSSPTTNYGVLASVRIRAANATTPTIYRTYLQFNVTGLTAPVSGAKLRLYVTDPSPDGGTVYPTTNNWTEATLNWNNAPLPGTASLVVGGAAGLNTWIEYNLPASAFGAGNATYSFVITGNSSDSAIFNSKEAAGYAPQLVVAQDAPAAPALSADFTSDKQSGTAPLTVNFNSTSSAGNPTSWSWDFNNDGVVDSTQQNPSFTYTTSGTYTVKLTIGDGTATNSVTKANDITVSSPPPPVTATLVGDACVNSTSATKNYGNKLTLQVRQGTTANPITYHSYLQFNLSGLTAPVTSAKLRLYVTDPSPDGGSVFDVSNAWTELGITWNNAPQPTSITPLARVGAVAVNTWVEVPLPAAEFSAGNGSYSFELASGNSNSAVYNSKQSTYPPQLIVSQGP